MLLYNSNKKKSKEYIEIIVKFRETILFNHQFLRN